jgi:hypothetical protein
MGRKLERELRNLNIEPRLLDLCRNLSEKPTDREILRFLRDNESLGRLRELARELDEQRATFGFDVDALCSLSIKEDLKNRTRAMRKHYMLRIFGSHKNRDDQPRIIRPPGSFLNCIAKFLCSRKTYELVATQTINDMRTEYSTAVAAKDHLKAAWVRVRGNWSFFMALGLHRLLRTVAELWFKVSSK